MIRVEVDKTVIEPDEIVTFTAYADPIEDIDVEAYVGTARVASYTIYLETLGINTLRIKPSMIGNVVTFRFRGVKTGSTADPITISIKGAVPTPTPTPTPTPAPAKQKVADVEIHFIRLPFVSDDFIKQGCETIVNGALWMAEKLSLTEGKHLWTAKEDIELKQIDWARWVAICPVYSEGTPIPWAFIAGLIVGAVVAGIIIYFVQVRPLKETLVNVSKRIDQVISEIEDAKQRGEIPPEKADQLINELRGASEEARRAGEDPFYEWTKYFEPVVKAIPTILMFALAIVIVSAVVGLIQRRRE